MKKAKARRDQQIKLKNQKKKEEELLLEKMRKEEELVLMERNYADTQEELDSLRRNIATLRDKQKAVKDELSDIDHEHQAEKEELLTDIRELTKQYDFHKQIVDIVMMPEEVEVIKKHSKQSHSEGTWSMPKFVLKHKKVRFPKLKGINQVQEYVDTDKQTRIMKFVEKWGENPYKNNSKNLTPTVEDMDENFDTDEDIDIGYKPSGLSGFNRTDNNF